MSGSMEWLPKLADWTLRNSLDGAILFLVVAAMLFAFRFRLAPQLKIGLLILVGIRLFLPLAPESSWSLRGMVPSFQSFNASAHSETCLLYTSPSPRDRG